MLILVRVRVRVNTVLVRVLREPSQKLPDFLNFSEFNKQIFQLQLILKTSSCCLESLFKIFCIEGNIYILLKPKSILVRDPTPFLTKLTIMKEKY